MSGSGTVADPRQISRMQSVLRGRSDDHGASPTHALPIELIERLGGEASGSEQRFAKRRRTKMQALIVKPNGRHAMTCAVRDISSTGVLIHMPVDANSVSRAGEEVPPRFTLQIPLERIEVECELAWRQANRLGARFISPTRILEAPERRPISRRPQPISTASSIVGKLFNR